MPGVPVSVPHGGFFTLLFTGEVISLSSSSGIVVVHLRKLKKKRIDWTAGSVSWRLTQDEKEANFIKRVLRRAVYFLKPVRRFLLYQIAINVDLFSCKLLLGEGLEVIYSFYPIIKHDGLTLLDSGCLVTLFTRCTA